ANVTRVLDLATGKTAEVEGSGAKTGRVIDDYDIAEFTPGAKYLVGLGRAKNGVAIGLWDESSLKPVELHVESRLKGKNGAPPHVMSWAFAGDDSQIAIAHDDTRLTVVALPSLRVA